MWVQIYYINVCVHFEKKDLNASFQWDVYVFVLHFFTGKWTPSAKVPSRNLKSSEKVCEKIPEFPRCEQPDN